VYLSRALCIIVLRSQGSDYSATLRGLNKGQKKKIQFWNKAKIFSIFSVYTDACTSSCKIVVASKRPLIFFSLLTLRSTAKARANVHHAIACVSHLLVQSCTSTKFVNNSFVYNVFIYALILTIILQTSYYLYILKLSLYGSNYWKISVIVFRWLSN